MNKKTAYGLSFCFALALACFPASVYARNFQFQLYKGESTTRSGWTDAVKKDTFKLTIGAAGTKDSDEPMEIRAATLLKDVRTKLIEINDVASLRFTPARGKQIYYIGAGVANSTSYSGHIKAGVIIEVWQGGKMLKHWSSSTGPITKTKLSDKVKCAYIDSHGARTFNGSFDNATQITADESNPEPEVATTTAEKDGGAAPAAGDAVSAPVADVELVLSDFAMAMFRADASLTSITRNGTMTISGDYFGPFAESSLTHWSVEIVLECLDGSFTVNGYALKASPLGERLKNLLKDGAPHRALVKLSRAPSGFGSTRYLTLDDFREIEADPVADVTGGGAGAEELTPSDYSYAMFRADASLDTITMLTKVRLSDEYSAPFADSQVTHWSIEICYPIGDGGWSVVNGYVEKVSPVGRRLVDLVRDGAQHPVLIKVARSQPGSVGTRCVVIKDFKCLEADGSSVPSRTVSAQTVRPVARPSAPKEDPEALLRAEDRHEQEMLRRRRQQQGQ